MNDLTVLIRALQMHDRAIAVRKDLIDNHLTTGAPYPIADIFRQRSMRPIGKEDLTRLVRRGSFTVRQSDGGKQLINQPKPEFAFAIDPLFSAQLEQQVVQFNVTVPKEIVLTVRSEIPLVLDFATPLIFTLRDDITINGRILPVGPRQALICATLADDFFEYRFRDTEDETAPLLVLHFQTSNRLNSEIREQLAEYFADIPEEGVATGPLDRDDIWSCACSLCGAFNAPETGWYIIRCLAQCDTTYLKKDDSACGDKVGGPYKTQDEAQKNAATLCSQA